MPGGAGEDPRVKGVVLRGILRDVKEHHPGGIAAFMELIPEWIRKAHFAYNLVHGVWYPYEAYTALLEACVAGAAGRTEVVAELAERAARRDLGTLLKVYAAFSSPHRVGQHAAGVWERRFQDVGRMVMSEQGSNSFRLTLEGFTLHPLNCSFLVGYGTGVGRHWEAAFTVHHDHCVHREAQLCSFLAQW